MFVKALRVAGFKSFASATVLEFEPGVNVIVGPNGSGKSNIADALSWVLGSQAPSTLRGGSMEDVIFAGSDKRPRLGAAEVELTLDNSSGVLPLDLSEVTVSRFTDRSGASEYGINGAPCRLLDIAELLSDTGVGRALHTVVGQGQLDQVLQARPEERRAFIEEAAQIGKFRRRKDRALRKMERVDDNLMRLNDVLTELRRSIRPLKRQATTAGRHSELVNEYVGCKQRLAATEVQRLALQESELDLEGAKQRGALLAEELASLRARLGTAGEERLALGTAAEQAREIAHRMARGADRLASLGRLAAERSERLRARLAAETEEGYRERIRLLETDLERWAADTQRVRDEASAATGKMEAARGLAQRSRTVLVDAEATLAGARTAETEAAQVVVRAEGTEAAGRAGIGSIEARISAVLDRRAVAEHQLAREGAAINSTETEVGSLERELDSVTETAARAESQLEEQRLHTDGLRERFNTTHSEHAAMRARVQAFDEVLQLFADQPDVVQKLRPLIEDAAARLRTASASEDEAARMVSQAEAAAELKWQDVAKLDEELRRLDALVAGAAERLTGLRRDHDKREIEIAALNDELARVREALAAAERAAMEDRAALPAVRAALQEAVGKREEAERHVGVARSEAEMQVGAANAAEIEARGMHERALAAQHRVEEIEAGIADARAALEGLTDLRTALRAACERSERVGEAASLAARRAETWTSRADSRAISAREQAATAEEQLRSMRARERELETSYEEVTQHKNQVEIRRAETRARFEALAERAMDEWGLTASELMRTEPFSVPEEAEARSHLERLERELKRLGPVNPNAAQEFAEVSERETFLVDQTEDLKSSKRDLMRIVHEVDETIVAVFGEAFDEVAREFEGVIQRLFPGGAGRLKLTDPDDLLVSGIEIEARPPGKTVKKMSLLSGGERSLVALAFLFSIFRARPSPFYLLDEVEAALDDINLQRFLGLVAELEARAQILIVTHQKRTMEAADVLYGVTMAKDGVSQVVAKRMDRDRSSVDAAAGDDVRIIDVPEAGLPRVV